MTTTGTMSTVLAALQQLIEGVKNRSPEITAVLQTFITNYEAYENVARPLNMLYELVSSTQSVELSRATTILDEICDKIPELAGQRDAFLTALQRPEIADPQILKSLQHCMRERANVALNISLGVSLVGLLIEFQKLGAVTDDIRQAEIFARTEYQTTMQEARRKLGKIQTEIETFAGGLQPSQFKNLNDNQRMAFVVMKTQEKNVIRGSLDEIREAIGRLEIEINGSKIKLAAFIRGAGPAAKAQVLAGVGIGAKLRLFGWSANPYLAAANGVMMAGHFVAAAVNIRSKRKAEATMKQLGEKLGEIDEIRNDITAQQQKLDEAFLEFMEAIERHRETEVDADDWQTASYFLVLLVVFWFLGRL